MIERLIAILLLVGFIGAVGCFVAPFLSARCHSWINRNVLLKRAVERWRCIGP